MQAPDDTAPTIDGRGAATPDEEWPPSTSPEPSEQRVVGGRYRIRRTLERGGMGIVQFAQDLELSNRPVVIKQIRPSDNPARREALRRQLVQEAFKHARVIHPNIVGLLELVDHADETFLVLEHVDGQSLRKWEKNRNWRRVLEVYLDAARGLAAAHDGGLVHCDFKANNVVVSRRGVARVIDFGIATLIEGEDAPTCEERPRGTPHHIAPERYRGVRPDPRSDQFSWCVALWHALAGCYPFDDLEGEALERAITAGPVGNIPRWWLRSVLLRGMSTHPEDRFPSMNALVAEIERRSRRRRGLRRGLALSGIGAAAVAAGWAFAPRPGSVADGEPCADFLARANELEAVRAELAEKGGGNTHRLALQRVESAVAQWKLDAVMNCEGGLIPRVRGPTAACMRTWIELLESGLAYLREDLVESDMPEFLERMLPTAGDYCVAPPPIDPKVWQYAEIARVHAFDGRLALARDYAERAKAAAMEIKGSGRYDANLAEALEAQAQVLVRSGDDSRLEDAIELLSQAQVQARGSGYRAGQLSALLRSAKLFTMFAQPRIAEASAALSEAEAVAHDLRVNRHSLMKAELEDTRGLVHVAAGRTDEALAAHSDARNLFNELGRPIGAAKTLVNLAAAHWARSEWDEARSTYMRARATLLEHGVPPTHDMLIKAEFGLGVVAIERGDPGGLAHLRHVVDHGPPRKRAEALALLTQLSVEVDNVEGARMWGRRCFDEIEVVDDEQRTTWGLICGLSMAYAGDPMGEQAVAEILSTGSHYAAYYDGARNWVMFLVAHERCDEAMAALPPLDAYVESRPNLESYSTWRASQLRACELTEN